MTPDSPRYLLMADRLGGQCRYSGIHQLARFLRTERSVRIIDTPDTRLRRFAGKAWSVLRRWPVRNQSQAFTELEAACALAVSPLAAVHFLVGENHDPYLSLPPGKQPVIATLHIPSSARETPPPRTGRVHTLVLLAAREQDFFAGAWGARRTVVIPHGVDTDFFHPGAGPDPARPSVLIVGRFLRDFPLTAATVVLLAGRHPDWRFDFVVPEAAWRSPDLAAVRALPGARWHDRVDDETLRRLYQESACHLSPFVDCTANNALVESLACGLPVVTTDRGGVRDYGAGTVYPLAFERSAPALAALCERYAAEPAWRAAIATACRTFAVESLAWPVIAHRYLGLYADVGRDAAASAPRAARPAWRGACNRLKYWLDGNDLAWTLPLPPWAAARARQVRGIRIAARTVLRRRLVAERGWLYVCTSSAAWPLLAAVKAALAWRLSVREVPRLWWLQVAHNLRIADQQDFRLDRPEQRRRARYFVTDGENKALMEFLNRRARPERVRDKIPFAAYCAEHDLPTVAVIATSAGAGAAACWLAPLPAGDLFLKPAALWGGQGACILTHEASGRTWRADDDTCLTRDTLADYADRRLGGLSWILQPRLRNGPAWTAFSAGTLNTVRVVTGRKNAGTPVEVIGGFMRFPRAHAVVDNLSAGGLGADYDAAGRLGRARSLDPASPLYDRHPDTGAAIAGTLIPEWERVAALALRAHAPITDIAMIGWDVALPENRPVLVEGNTNWGVLLDTPLGDTRYVEILLQPGWRCR
jgi:glycosyltransferase involved in cell wall biosynthesis